MIHRVGILGVAACLVLGGVPELRAGGIHILYRADAPEKLAVANEIYTRQMMHLYHHHPQKFAHEHPFFAEMFHNPVMMDRLVARWEAHEQRFEYWHNSLWRVLDAYAIAHEHPALHLPIVLSSSDFAVPEVPEKESGGRSPGPGGPGGRSPGPGGPGGGIRDPLGGGSVPEPSAAVLVISGLGAVLIGLVRRSVFRRLLIGQRGSG